ncbi:AAA family ATPase [Roseomonas marmotae]|uniref:AAA family ATPase n=1 Tax=Roseomonas marmotae TaxID=2768161 RepID=A0ABS3KG20_9PROT|nr:AAA family ATPase [Roseomonas marmotae]MBO1075860.1 AAA family ATPase [Roseomonas marmotae]QTI81950.1 AAA family ATPase [Roseomonas marmotae]
MRLTSLSLRHYGSFADSNLEFDPAPGRINLVLAPNGAGKSVLRSALGDLLFGIGAQTPMGFRHGYAGMRILARGTGPDGRPFTLDRSKGRTNTLLDDAGQPVGAAGLARLAGTADRALLERLFALDTERLRSGGQGLLASGGALAEALLQAAGGMRQARTLRLALEGDRDRLAPTRKRAQAPFYAALDRLATSRRLLKDSTVRPEGWQQRDRALAEAMRQREEAQQAARQAGAAIHRMERVRRIRPLLARLDAASAWMAANPDSPQLPEGLQDRLSAALRMAEQGTETLRVARQRHDALLEQARGVTPDATLLAQAEAIRALQEAAGAAAKARLALPELEETLRALEAGMAEHRLALGLAADAPLPPPALLRQARELAEEHARRAMAAEALPGRIAGLEAEWREAAEALRRMPPAEEPEELTALLAEIAAEGEPVRLATGAAREVEQARARLAAETACLPEVLRTAGVLHALSPPPPALLERLWEAREAAMDAARRAEAEHARLDAALRQARQDRAVLDRQGSLPDEAALAHARRRREEGWHLIFRRAFAGPVDAAAEQAFAGAEPLPLAYARAVAEADAIADQRLLEAERLTRAADLDGAILRQQAGLEQAAEAARAAREEAVAAEAAWTALLEPCGLAPGARRSELAALLAQRETCLKAALALEDALAAARELEARQAAQAKRLAHALGLAGDGQDLRALLDLASARQREARRGVEARAALAARHDTAARDLAQARRDLEEAEARIAAWRQEWGEVARRLGRDPEERAGQGIASLALFEELRGLSAQASDLRARVAGMRAEIEGFGAECLRLHKAVTGAAPEDVFAAARALRQRLEQEEAEASRLALLRQQAEAAEREVETAGRQAAEAGAALRGVLAEAGAGTAEEATRRLALAALWRDQAAAQASALEDLRQAGDGLPPEALRTEAAELAAETLEDLLAAARAEQQAQQDRIAEASAQAARLQAELDALHADDGVSRAAQDQQAAIAQLGRTLEEAVLAQLAASLLESAMGRLQEAGDDALLRRIGATFAALTEGAYPAVQSREDEKGVAHLVIRRRDFPEEETLVEALSEGTRDQLFLALRLVAIEDQVAEGTCLPFLGDDILQSFDDRRAAAAFRALLDFSTTAQVILLSHHRHLAGIAADALPPGALHLQSLE